EIVSVYTMASPSVTLVLSTLLLISRSGALAVTGVTFVEQLSLSSDSTMVLFGSTQAWLSKVPPSAVMNTGIVIVTLSNPFESPLPLRSPTQLTTLTGFSRTWHAKLPGVAWTLPSGISPTGSGSVTRTPVAGATPSFETDRTYCVVSFW